MKEEPKEEPMEEPMFARVTTAHGAPERLEAGLAALPDGLRANREQAATVSELPPPVRGSLVAAFGVTGAVTHEVYEVAVRP